MNSVISLNEIITRLEQHIDNSTEAASELANLGKYFESNSFTSSPEDLQLTMILYRLIWSTPVFKKQVVLIDLIISNLSTDCHLALTHFVIIQFRNIREDRRDKFYYFLDRSWKLIPFADLFTIEDTDVLTSVTRYINKTRPSDWNDSVFLNFFCYCKPWLCLEMADIRISEAVVRPFLKLTDIPQQNRSALYGLFK